MAFAPADKPKIALAVVVENAGFGAAHAAPIARRVFDYVLMGQYPNDEDMLAVQKGLAAAPIGKPKMAADMASIASSTPASPSAAPALAAAPLSATPPVGAVSTKAAAVAAAPAVRTVNSGMPKPQPQAVQVPVKTAATAPTVRPTVQLN